MKRRLGWVLLACAVLPFLIGAADGALGKGGAPVTIVIVRHGEKSSQSGDVPLSEAGKTRALLLASMLESAEITAVFSSELTFARETAAPLAAKKKLEPVVIPVRETASLVTELGKLPAGAIAVVVNHSGNIASIIEQLGAKRPAAIGTEEFDRMFVVSRSAAGAATVVEMRYRQEK